MALSRAAATPAERVGAIRRRSERRDAPDDWDAATRTRALAAHAEDELVGYAFDDIPPPLVFPERLLPFLSSSAPMGLHEVPRHQWVHGLSV